ncbi:hypothetical protein CC79DRAFT_816689 [Sarocladium strictum]
MAKHWDDWRDTIISYYINDNLTLRDVMQIMRDRHGFIASQRSYRQKFKDWGIRKYRQHGETWSSPSGSPQSATRLDPPQYEPQAPNPSSQTAPELSYAPYNTVSHNTNQNGWSRNEGTSRSYQPFQQGHQAWSQPTASYQYPVSVPRTRTVPATVAPYVTSILSYRCPILTFPRPQQTYTTQPAQHQHGYNGYQPSSRPSQPYATSHTQQQQQGPPYY